MKKCPKCRLTNPDSALICDCGYNFNTATSGTPIAGAEKRAAVTPGTGWWIDLIPAAFGAQLVAQMFSYKSATDPNTAATIVGLASVAGFVVGGLMSLLIRRQIEAQLASKNSGIIRPVQIACAIVLACLFEGGTVWLKH